MSSYYLLIVFMMTVVRTELMNVQLFVFLIKEDQFVIILTWPLQGDSGASAMLLVQQRLVAVGIAASSRFCGYSPDRYIRVAVYLEWLHTSINDSPKDFSTPE